MADAAGVVTGGADRVDTGQRRLGLLGNKSGTTSRGFVLLLKFYEIEGRFSASRKRSHRAAVTYTVRVGAGRARGSTLDHIKIVAACGQ